MGDLVILAHKVRSRKNTADERKLISDRLIDGTYSTQMYGGGKSDVWNYFQRVHDGHGVALDYVACQLCGKVLSFQGRSTGTSAMKKHTEDSCTARFSISSRPKKKEPKFRRGRPAATKNDLRQQPYHLTYDLLKDPGVLFDVVNAQSEDRKLNIGTTNSGISSTDVPNFTDSAMCDNVSVPVSPEQFLADEGDIGTNAPSLESAQRIAESYKLRHNNHLTLVLESLAGDESFMDVTLTAEGKSIKAHKSVLSAVSPYFSNVLKENPCQHPIIIMPRDIRFEELQNIISYIYKGEITVATVELSSLLKTAEVLQVTGLSAPEAMGAFAGYNGNFYSDVTEVKGNKSSSSWGQNQEFEDLQEESQHRIDPTDFLNADMTLIKEEVSSGEEDSDPLHVGATNTTLPTKKKRKLNSSPNSPVHSNDPPISSNSDPPKQSSVPPTKDGSEAAKESVITSPPYICPHCSESYRPLEIMNTHLKLKHPSKPSFLCSHCGRVFVRQNSFHEHQKKCEKL